MDKNLDPINISLHDLLEKFHKERRQEREDLVRDQKQNFQRSVADTKEQILNGDRIEPRWVTKLIGVVLAKRLERAAAQQVRESNLSALQRFDRDTPECEANVQQCWEAEAQFGRPPIVIGPRTRTKGTRRDRGPERER